MAQLDQRARQVVDPVQRQIRHDKVETARRERQELLVRPPRTPRHSALPSRRKGRCSRPRCHGRAAAAPPRRGPTSSACENGSIVSSSRSSNRSAASRSTSATRSTTGAARSRGAARRLGRIRAWHPPPDVPPRPCVAKRHTQRLGCDKPQKRRNNATHQRHHLARLAGRRQELACSMRARTASLAPPTCSGRALRLGQEGNPRPRAAAAAGDADLLRR